MVPKRSLDETRIWQMSKDGPLRRTSNFVYIPPLWSRRAISFLTVRLDLLYSGWHKCSDIVPRWSRLDLPPNVRLEDVYSDFFSYIIRHTREHVRVDTGNDPWSSASDVEIIIAHPNKWGKHEQNFLLNAMISADIINDVDTAKSRVYFVEEAEASARYCISGSSTPFVSQLKVCGIRPGRYYIPPILLSYLERLQVYCV